MSVFSVIGSVAKEIIRVGLILLPILKSYRESDPEFDDWMDRVDGLLEKGGTEAAEFLNENEHVLDAMFEYATDMIEAASQVRIVARFAKEIKSDGMVTPAEAAVLARHIAEMKDKVMAFTQRDNSELVDALEALE